MLACSYFVKLMNHVVLYLSSHFLAIFMLVFSNLL